MRIPFWPYKHEFEMKMPMTQYREGSWHLGCIWCSIVYRRSIKEFHSLPYEQALCSRSYTRFTLNEWRSGVVDCWYRGRF